MYNTEGHCARLFRLELTVILVKSFLLIRILLIWRRNDMKKLIAIFAVAGFLLVAAANAMPDIKGLAYHMQGGSLPNNCD